MTIQEKIKKILLLEDGSLSELGCDPEKGFEVWIIRTIECPECHGTGGDKYAESGCGCCDGGKQIYAGTHGDVNPYSDQRFFGEDLDAALDFMISFYESDQSIYV